MWTEIEKATETLVKNIRNEGQNLIKTLENFGKEITLQISDITHIDKDKLITRKSNSNINELKEHIYKNISAKEKIEEKIGSLNRFQIDCYFKSISLNGEIGYLDKKSLEKKTLLIIGPMGHGKKSTCNTIIEDYSFDTSSVEKDNKAKINFHNLMIANLENSGFENQNLFSQKFLNENNLLLKVLEKKHLSAFLLVIKFEMKESLGFYDVARQFFEIFGTAGVKSVIILCIQEGIRFEESIFDISIKQSNGYQYLKSKNSNKDVNYCFWDNMTPDQISKLSSLVCQVERFTKKDMESAFDNLKNSLNWKTWIFKKIYLK